MVLMIKREKTVFQERSSKKRVFVSKILFSKIRLEGF